MGRCNCDKHPTTVVTLRTFHHMKFVVNKKPLPTRTIPSWANPIRKTTTLCRPGGRIEYASLSACRVRQLKGCPDDSALQRGTTQDSCVTYTRIPVQILKPPVANPRSTPFTHGAICCWLDCTNPPYLAFPSSSLKFLHTPPSPTPSPSLPYVHES